MTEFQVVWYGQAAVMIVVTITLLIVMLRSARWSIAHRRAGGDGGEHGVLVSAAVLVIALGNVLTTVARALALDDLRDAGGIMVRGALILTVVYMAAWGPGSSRKR